MPDLTIENLSHVYSAGTPFEKVAVRDLNLTIPEGQFLAVIGHTGSGKSTFIQHLNALLQPSSGRVLYGGSDINESKLSRRDIRFKVGMVFQYPEYQLFEETVYKDIAFGPKNMKLTDAEVDACVRGAAELTGIGEEMFELSPLELSGGQKRRVAIAGVMAMRPGVLILDEPTAGLDPAGCRTILDNILAYREKTGATVIIVSHNMSDVARFAQRIIVFNEGSIAMDGTPEEVFSRAQELLDIGLNVPDATVVAMALKQHGMPIEGAVYTHEQLLAAVLKAKGATGC